jgi:predicted nucleotidyltransferase
MGKFSTVIDTENVLSLEEIRKRLEPVFSSKQVNKAILFGSYAKNCAHEKSDVDILVYSELRGLKFYELLGAAILALN